MVEVWQVNAEPPRRIRKKKPRSVERGFDVPASRPHFGQPGCMQVISDGYHFPSMPHLCIVHQLFLQTAVLYCHATQVAGAAAFFFLAAKDGVENDTAIAATAATTTNFEIIFSMTSPRFAESGGKELHNGF